MDLYTQLSEAASNERRPDEPRPGTYLTKVVETVDEERIGVLLGSLNL